MRSVEQMDGGGWECSVAISHSCLFSHILSPVVREHVEGGRVVSLKHYSFTLGSISLELWNHVLGYSYHHSEHVCLFCNGCVRKQLTKGYSEWKRLEPMADFEQCKLCGRP